MKKTLALVLSLALAVALCVGLFVISSSADTATEKTIGETRAEAAWAEANKATAVKFSVYGKVVEITEAVTDKALADIFKDVVFVEGEAAATTEVVLSGKVTFANGELTLDGANATVNTKDAEGKVSSANKNALKILPNGGLYVTVKGGDFYGEFNLNDTTEPLAPLPDKSHLIITSPDNSVLRGNGGGNAITNTWGHIIIFGNIGIDIEQGENYDAIITRNPKNEGSEDKNTGKKTGWKFNETVIATTYTAHDIVIDVPVARFNGTKNGPAVDCRTGAVVYGKDLMYICTGNASAPLVHAQAPAGTDMVIGDNVKFFIENGKGPQVNSTNGTLYIQDNALIYHKADNIASWNHTINGVNLNVSGGTIIADWSGFAAAAAAPIQTNGGTEAVFSGGKFFLNVVGGTAGTRATGILFKHNGTVTFSGGDFYINVEDTAGNASDAVIRTQKSSSTAVTEINFSGANFKITANAESKLFRLENNDCAINFTAGSFDANIAGNLFNVAAAKKVPVTVGENAKVNIVAGKDNDNVAGSTVTVNNVAFEATSKEIKNGTVIAMAETAPAFAAPANVKASDVTKDSAKVTWDAVKGAKAYAVTLNGVQLDPVTTNEIAIADLVPSLKCTVTVTALYTDNIATEAATVEFTTEAGEATGPVVGAPTDLKVVAVNSKKAVLSWTPVEGAVAYSIYVNGEPVMDGEAVKQISETTYVINKSADVALTSWSLLGETEKSAALKVTLEDPAKLPYFVEVTTADGTLVYLTKDNASIEGVTYDAATGTITLNNATIRGISATGRLTIVAKGTNTVGTGNEGRIFDADDLIFEGDGKIVVDANVSNYPVYACSLIVFQGSINFELNGGDKVSSAIHPGRGTNDTRGGTGDTGVIFREKATVVLNVPTGMGLNIVGLRPKLISTDMAKVTINGNTKSDAARVIADTANASDVDLSKGASSYTEFSGKTEFTITMGNCGFRNQVTVDTSAEAVKSVLFNKPTSVEFIVKGYAKVDVTAPGQTVYLRNDGAKNDAEVIDVVTLKVTENGSLKITNIGPASNGSDYQCIQINTDEANFIIDGGSIEMIKGCDESALADGKKRVGIMSVPTTTKYTIGANATTYVFGKDAENAKTQTKVQAGAYYGKIAFAENTSVKYVASNFNDMGLDFFTLNNKTSDVNVLPFAAMSVLALVGLAAVVVLRKKFN